MFESMLTLDTEWWIPTRRQRGWAMPERSVEEHLAACEVRYREVRPSSPGSASRLGSLAAARTAVAGPTVPARPTSRHTGPTGTGQQK